MTKSALTILAVTSTLVLGGMVRANAAPITETYDFNVTFPAGAPFSTWDGSFTITFDPTAPQEVIVGPSAFVSFSSNLPASYDPFVFTYHGAGGFLIIGDDCVPGDCVAGAGADTAWMDIFPVTASGGLTFHSATLGGPPMPSLPLRQTGV